MSKVYEVQIPVSEVELVGLELKHDHLNLTVKRPDGTLEPLHIGFVPGCRFLLLKSVGIDLTGGPVEFDLMVQTSGNLPLCFRVQCQTSLDAFRAANSIRDHAREYKRLTA